MTCSTILLHLLFKSKFTNETQLQIINFGYSPKTLTQRLFAISFQVQDYLPSQFGFYALCSIDSHSCINNDYSSYIFIFKSDPHYTGEFMHMPILVL